MMKQQDHYWASLTYVQEEGHAAGHAEGVKLDIEKGCVAGRGEGIEQLKLLDVLKERS